MYCSIDIAFIISLVKQPQQQQTVVAIQRPAIE